MTGKSFGGCVRYVVQKEGATVLEADGIRTDAVPAMVADFNLQRSLNPDLEQAVGHIALSWSVHDRAKLNAQVMVERAKEYLERMQIRDTQYLIVLHQDREHPHVHIVYNRVSYAGKTISDRFQRRRNAQVCREITERHGYYLAPGKGQVNRQRLKGADKAKYELHEAIRQSLQQARTWQELERLLLSKDIFLDYKYKRGTEQVQGISFRLGQLSFKGSSLDRRLSYGAISRQLALNSRQGQLRIPDLKPRPESHIHPGNTASALQARPHAQSLLPQQGASLVSSLLQAEDMGVANAYEFRRKRRRKKKRMHL